ncbi:hypothetical protein [Streptomyces sp. bgisy100]|uniref:hypothetical protein n=1 Tax=Streptomyces sp. bgisy100 TaxID=3413783 RepID=UPI003D74EE26
MRFKRNAFAVGIAATLSAVAFGLSTPVAQAAESATPGGVDCDGWTHANNPDHGIAGCTNNTDHPVTFRAEIVCGRAPDVSGQWVTLAPGQYSESQGVCAFYSSGVGRVGWTIQ